MRFRRRVTFGWGESIFNAAVPKLRLCQSSVRRLQTPSIGLVTGVNQEYSRCGLRGRERLSLDDLRPFALTGEQYLYNARLSFYAQGESEAVVENSDSHRYEVSKLEVGDNAYSETPLFAREGDWPKAKPARGVHALATHNLNTRAKPTLLPIGVIRNQTI